MEITTLPLVTAIISGGLMFFVGFFTGQRTAERRSKFYDRIREV